LTKHEILSIITLSVPGLNTYPPPILSKTYQDLLSPNKPFWARTNLSGIHSFFLKM